MPHYIGPNRQVQVVTRKVFENFNRCEDYRAFEVACLEQANDSWREIRVNQKHDDPDMEHLRQWLLANGAEESDEYVLIVISW